MHTMRLHRARPDPDFHVTPISTLLIEIPSTAGVTRARTKCKVEDAGEIVFATRALLV